MRNIATMAGKPTPKDGHKYVGSLASSKGNVKEEKEEVSKEKGWRYGGRRKGRPKGQ